MNDEYSQSHTRPETADIHVDVKNLKNLRLTGLTNLYEQRPENGSGVYKYRSVDIKKIIYKTNNDSISKEYRNKESNKNFDFTLKNGEYFTELIITVDTQIQPIYTINNPNPKHEYNISLYISNPHLNTYSDEKDMLRFYLNNDENYRENELSYNNFNEKHKVELTLGLINRKSSAPSKTMSVGDEIDISVSMGRYNQFAGKLADDTPKDIFVNPTFYFMIPRHYSYVENSFNLTTLQENAQISVLSAEDLKYYFLKVEFYGDSDIVFKNSIDMNFKLKIEQFAPRGNVSESIEIYEDVKDTLEVYEKYIEKNQWLQIKTYPRPIIVGGNRINPIIATVSTSVNGEILHGTNTLILQKVNTDVDALLKNKAEIKSGQTYNSFIDIVNNSVGLQDFTMYIPVPRTSRDDGLGSYKWDARLLKAVGINGSNVVVKYSTEDNPTKNKWENGTEDVYGMYVNANSITDFSKVTMIKISANKINTSNSISVNASFSDLSPKSDTGDKESKIYGYYSYKVDNSSNYIKSQSPAVTVTLKDTIISGYLFEDNNGDGLKNNGDTFLANKEVTLYDGEGHVDGQARSDANGFYRFKVPSIPENGYLMIEKIPGYSYTINKNEENPTSIVSSFDPKTEKAYPTLSNSEKLNAGFIKTPDITLKSDSLTVRVNKTGTIVYDLLPPDMSKDIKFESADNTIATVDDKGIVTGLAVGETNVRVYYETVTGLKIYKDVRIIVIVNDPSVFIQIPKYIELKDDGTDDIKASPEVQLYSGNDMEGNKINVPKVNIYVDSSIVLQKDAVEFTAQTYKKDNQPYTNPALPILQLESGKLEEDSFYLKANKKTIPKNIGVYQGLLNFTMKYEGD